MYDTTVIEMGMAAWAGELLHAAAVRIERHGLCQGEYWPIDWARRCYLEGDPCCVLGALAVAAGIEDPDRAEAEFDTDPGLRIAVDALSAALGDELSCWNDEPGRAATEVVAALRAEADRLTFVACEPDPDPRPAAGTGCRAAPAGGFPAPAGA